MNHLERHIKQTKGGVVVSNALLIAAALWLQDKLSDLEKARCVCAQYAQSAATALPASQSDSTALAGNSSRGQLPRPETASTEPEPETTLTANGIWTLQAIFRDRPEHWTNLIRIFPELTNSPVQYPDVQSLMATLKETP